MNYEEKYKQALERASKLRVQNPFDTVGQMVENIFPELQESEYERIRKTILELVKQSSEILGKQNQNNMIAWLEKQGEKATNINGEDYDIDGLYHAIRILEETVGKVTGYQSDDGILEHKAAINVVKKLYKKQGEKSINHTDIKEKAHQIACETSKDYDPSLSKEAWCEMAALDMASWLKREVDDAYLQGICDAKHEIEKQGEQKQTWKPSEAQLIVIKELIEDKNTSKVHKTILRGMLNELEKQGKSTRTNVETPFDIEIPFGASDSELQEVSYDIPEGFNAEIKDDRVVIKKTTFKVGNWVVKNGIVAKILDKQKYGFVGLDVDGNDFFCNYGHTDSMRLWTITDAKDGDVLFHSDSASNGIFIFKEILQRGTIQEVVCYCDYDSEDGFCLGEKHTCCWTDSKILHPASKEQRDLLFQKMKEAGYKWDAEKKELKKIEVKSENIEPKPLDANKVIEWLNDQACLGWIEDVEVSKFIEKFKKDFKL